MSEDGAVVELHGQQREPNTLDSDGYPVTLPKGGVYTIFFVPSQIDRPGTYVATWEGNGTIHFGMSHSPISGSRTSSNRSGRYEFFTSETRFVVGIAELGYPHITNMKVFFRHDEAAIDAGKIFGVRLKERLTEANFGVIRFVNWQSSNTTNVTAWATRKPTTDAFYAGSEFS